MGKVFSYFVMFKIIMSMMLFSGCANRDNKLELGFDSTIKKEAVNIEMEVLGSIPKTTIYDRGKEVKIPNGYGENEWYFLYNDTLKGYIRHIKTNRNDNHNYKFSFYEKNEQCFVDVEITGISPLTKTIQLK
jgi:uncharacterized protein YprB with RNaseH-like and TPR domain